MIEQEESVSSKLKVNFTQLCEDKNDFIEVNSQINQERHPILHKFISMKIDYFLKEEEEVEAIFMDPSFRFSS